MDISSISFWSARIYSPLRSGSSASTRICGDSRYRMVAFMYLVPLLVFWIDKGRFYYVAESYPMLIAMGAVTSESWLLRVPRWSAPHH